MQLPFPGPSSLVGAASKGFEAIEQAMSLVPRLGGIVAEVEQIMVRAQGVVSGIEQTQQRAGAVVDQTAVLVARAGPLVEQLEQFEPTLLRLQPILERLAETTDPDEVTAIVAMLDLLPGLVEKLRDDIVPIMDTFGTVAPDLRDILDVSKELNEMLAAVPGLGRIKRKIEEQQDLEDDLRAEETPPPAPARKR